MLGRNLDRVDPDLVLSCAAYPGLNSSLDNLRARLHLTGAVVHLMHVRLLLGLLSSLCVGDWQAHAVVLQQQAEASAAHAQAACHGPGSNKYAVSLRQERQNKVECAPPISARVLYHAFLVDEPEHDDEENTDTRVAEYVRFPASAEHQGTAAMLPPLCLAQTQLERPPRA